MVFELARLRPLDRPVARVVHPGCELVGKQAAADLEQLERDHPHVAQLVEQERHELAVVSANGHDRALPLELDELLRQLVLADRLVLAHEPLPLAVVPEPARLDECR